MNKGKRVVMSESFMMKSYYYPSDDSPNSINGTFVIDFKNYSLDKKQKSQSGGAPDISKCSASQVGSTSDAPLQTMAAIYNCLCFSAAIEFVQIAEDNLINAAVVLMSVAPHNLLGFPATLTNLPHLPVDGVAQPLAGLQRADALAAARAAAAAAPGAARAAALARAAAAPGAVLAALAVNRNIEFNAAYDQLVKAQESLGKMKVNFGESILGIGPIGFNAKRTIAGIVTYDKTCEDAVDAANITSAIWNDFTNHMFQWIGTNARNKLMHISFGDDLIVFGIHELPAIPNSVERIPGNTNCWKIKGQIGQHDESHFTFHRSNANYLAGSAMLISSSHHGTPGAIHMTRNRAPILEIGSEWALCAKFNCALGYNELTNPNITYEIINRSCNVMVKNPAVGLFRPGGDPQARFFEGFLRKIGQELITVSNTIMPPVVAVAAEFAAPHAAAAAAAAPDAAAARAAAPAAAPGAAAAAAARARAITSVEAVFTAAAAAAPPAPARAAVERGRGRGRGRGAAPAAPARAAPAPARAAAAAAAAPGAAAAAAAALGAAVPTTLINLPTLDILLRRSLMDLTRTTDKYNVAKECILTPGVLWNNVFTTATMPLNCLCMVGDNRNGDMYPAWVTRNAHPINDVDVQPVLQVPLNPNQIVVAQNGSGPNAVLVKSPDITDMMHFYVPPWVEVGEQCMSLRIDPDAHTYLPGWNCASIVSIPVPNNARTVDVKIFPGGRALPVDQTVSIYAIRECVANEMAECQRRRREAEAKAARASKAEQAKREEEARARAAEAEEARARAEEEARARAAEAEAEETPARAAARAAEAEQAANKSLILQAIAARARATQSVPSVDESKDVYDRIDPGLRSGLLTEDTVKQVITEVRAKLNCTKKSNSKSTFALNDPFFQALAAGDYPRDKR
jgi:hypothetical protein